MAKPKKRKARCKQVLVILGNRIETVDLLEEKIYPPAETGDYDVDPIAYAVVKHHDVRVEVPLDCVVFLR